MLNIAGEQLKAYKRTARARHAARQGQDQALRERAWALAQRAAQLLKADYGATRVLLFGSLAQPDRFTHRSDIDIAAWGLTSTNWLKAGSTVRYLDQAHEFEINVVDTACAPSELLESIERYGVPL